MVTSLLTSTGDLESSVVNPALKISPVKLNGGVPIDRAIINGMSQPSYQDYDALYNSKLYNPATEFLKIQGSLPSWSTDWAYHPNNVTRSV